MKKHILTFLLASILPFLCCAQITTIRTSGNYSPSVFAKSSSVTYGLNPRVIDELLMIFERGGLSVINSKQEIELLLKKYTQLPNAEKADRELSQSSLKKLGVNDNSDLANIMQWIVYTKGDFSPAIIASGDVNIWYGISPSAFKKLYSIYIKKQGDILIQEGKIKEFKIELKEMVQKYNQLKAELELRGDDMAKEAKFHLENGRINEALAIMKNRYLLEESKLQRQVISTAKAAFDCAKAYEINFEFMEANQYFQKAIESQPNNTSYLFSLAANQTQLGEYQMAIKNLETAVTIDSINYGNIIHEKIAMKYSDIGFNYFNLSEYSKAILFYKKSLKIHQTIFGPIHEEIAILKNNIGQVYMNLGKIDTAIIMQKQALEMGIHLFGKNHLELTSTYNNLGSSYSYLEQWKKAIEYYQKSIDILLEFGENNDPELGVRYNNIAELYRKQDNFEQALQYFEQALENTLKAFGSEHPKTAIRYSNIGLFFEGLGKIDTALILYHKALYIDLKVYDKPHSALLRDYNNIGESYRKLENYKLAIDNLLKAKEIGLNLFGEHHPNVAICYNNLGLCYKGIKEYTKAIGYLEKSLTIIKEYVPSGHSVLKKIQENLDNAIKESE